MNRIDLCKKNYTALFGGEALTGLVPDLDFVHCACSFIHRRRLPAWVTMIATPVAVKPARETPVD